MKLTVNQQIVYDAFQAAGLDPCLGLAIAQQESNFDPSASVVTGGDARRGGSYGICQMSMKTALSLDRHATVALLMMPKYNAKLAAQLCAQNAKIANTKDPSELFSRYNSGRPFHLAPESTVTYCARANRFLTEWRAKLAQDSKPSN